MTRQPETLQRGGSADCQTNWMPIGFKSIAHEAGANDHYSAIVRRHCDYSSLPTRMRLAQSLV